MCCLLLLCKYPVQHPAQATRGGLPSRLLTHRPEPPATMCHFPNASRVARAGNVISISQRCRADLPLAPWGRQISSLACAAVHRALPPRRRRSLCGSRHFCSTRALFPRGSQAFRLPTSQEMLPQMNGEMGNLPRAGCAFPSLPEPRCQGSLQCNINNSL